MLRDCIRGAQPDIISCPKCGTENPRVIFFPRIERELRGCIIADAGLRPVTGTSYIADVFSLEEAISQREGFNTKPARTRERSYSSGYQLRGQASEMIFFVHMLVRWADTVERIDKLVDVRAARDKADFFVRWADVFVSVDVKSDRHLGASWSRGYLFETKRRYFGEHDQAGWGLASPADFIVFHAWATHAFHWVHLPSWRQVVHAQLATTVPTDGACTTQDIFTPLSASHTFVACVHADTDLTLSLLPQIRPWLQILPVEASNTGGG